MYQHVAALDWQLNRIVLLWGMQLAKVANMELATAAAVAFAKLFCTHAHCVYVI